MRCTPDLPNGAQARAGEEFCGQGKATTDILQTTHHNCTSLPESPHYNGQGAPQARAGEEVLRSRKAPRIFYALRTATALLRLRLHTTMTKSWPDSNHDAHLPWVVVGVRKSIMQSSFQCGRYIISIISVLEVAKRIPWHSTPILVLVLTFIVWTSAALTHHGE